MPLALYIQAGFPVLQGSSQTVSGVTGFHLQSVIACLLMQGTSNCRLSVVSVASLCTAKVTTIFCEHFIAIAWGCTLNAHSYVDCSFIGGDNDVDIKPAGHTASMMEDS